MKWKLVQIDKKHGKTIRAGNSGSHLKSVAREMYVAGCAVNFTIYDPNGSFWQRCNKVDSANCLVWSWR